MTRPSAPALHIFYVSQRDVLKGRVGAIMVMQSCRAFAKTGAAVTLIAPRFLRRANVPRREVWRHFGMDESFRIVMLPTLLWDGAWPLVIALAKVACHSLFALVILAAALRRPAGSIVIYSRDPVATWPYLLVLAAIRRARRIAFVFEAHAWRNRAYHRALLRRVDGIVYISEALRRSVERDLAPLSRPAVIGRMGVSVEDYAQPHDKAALRAAVALPASGIVAMYTGKVAPEMKEIDFIIQAARLTPAITVVVVGGVTAAVEYWRGRCARMAAANVSFIGFVPPARVRQYQLAADLLLMYYPSDWRVAGVFSPGKLMEYMATGNVIVSVNHAPIVEVLHPANAILVPPDAPEQLAAALARAAGDAGLRDRLGAEARKDVDRYTWDRRAESLRRFFSELQRNRPTTVVGRLSEQSG